MNTKPSPPQADKAPLKNLSIITLDIVPCAFSTTTGKGLFCPTYSLWREKKEILFGPGTDVFTLGNLLSI